MTPGVSHGIAFGARCRKVTATALSAALILAACGGNPTLPPTSGPSSTISAGALTPGLGLADAIFVNAHVVTMDDARPAAEAIAVAGDRILAVGSDAELAAYRGPSTHVIDVAGSTITPGFIDAHQHRIGDGPAALGLEPKGLIDAAIAQGWTTIDELYVDQGRLDQLQQLDDAGVLRLHVNAYLPVQENSAAGTLLGDYFDAYRVGEQVSPHVRVAGLKVFTDFDNATILLWKQADLNAFLLTQFQHGWHIAIKTVSTKSLAMILAALESVRAADPGARIAGTRLEHVLFATQGQIDEMAQLGLQPVINLNNPGQLVGQPGIDELVASEPAGSYVPWKQIFDAGIEAAGMSGFPSLYVDEPSGAAFGSPIHLLYQGVTRVGNLGTTSPPALLGQALTIEQAMRSLTVTAARAGFEEDVKGSITPGKLADLVVLSGDPLTVPTASINDIGVVMTVIGGKTEFCATDAGAMCEASDSIPSAPGPIATEAPASTSAPAEVGGIAATASMSTLDHPPSAAIDGDPGTWWQAGSGPVQWLQLDLGSVRPVTGLTLVTSQYPAGATVHQILVGPSPNDLHIAGELDGVTHDGQTLQMSFEAGTEARYIRILTTASSSWVAWREVRVAP